MTRYGMGSSATLKSNGARSESSAGAAARSTRPGAPGGVRSEFRATAAGAGAPGTGAEAGEHAGMDSSRTIHNRFQYTGTLRLEMRFHRGRGVRGLLEPRRS